VVLGVGGLVLLGVLSLGVFSRSRTDPKGPVTKQTNPTTSTGDGESAKPDPKGPVAKPASFLLVSSQRSSNVLRYDAHSGKFIDVLIGRLESPAGLAEHGGRLYIACEQSHSVVRVTKNRTEAVVAPKSRGLGGPYGIAFGPDGKLYVTSRDDNSIKRYDGETGAFIDAVLPSGASGLNYPFDLTFGPDKKLYLTSRQEKTQAGSVICCDVKSGETTIFVPSHSGGLTEPSVLCFGPDGNLYVGSWADHSVRRYDGRTGSLLAMFVQPGAGGLKEPLGMAFGPDGNLYVSCGQTHSVLRYSGKSGAFIDAFVPPGAGGLKRPHYLLFTSELSP
jgi:DNA-binding beta-propeller fold protein YncE